MIPTLTSPAVCVIDEDPKDYGPILDAFTALGIGCLHIRGDESAPLPPAPFRGLRVVFTDLHLSASGGKGGAAHTANVFLKVVSPDAGPVAVVIWSKYAKDKAGENDLPPEDQPTEADLFKQAVLQAEPRFERLLMFAELPKPRPADRPAPEEWSKMLQGDIDAAFQHFPACNLLWMWEELLQDAGLTVAKEVTDLAAAVVDPESDNLDKRLATIFRVLSREQGGPECTADTAPKFVSVALAQAVIDGLDHSPKLEGLAPHGPWLCEKNPNPDTSSFASKLNGFFLSAAPPAAAVFVPGTVFQVTDSDQFKATVGVSFGELAFTCYRPSGEDNGWSKDQWRERGIPILLEISPACEFHQGTRRQASLIGGLVVPADGRKNVKQGDAFHAFPTFRLRWAVEGFPEQDVFLVFCSRYKTTLPHAAHPAWLHPWFRLRDLPTAALRNWHLNQASRVGYVSLR